MRASGDKGRGGSDSVTPEADQIKQAIQRAKKAAHPPGAPAHFGHFHETLPIAADGSWQSKPEHVSRTGRSCPNCECVYTIMVSGGAIHCSDCWTQIEPPVRRDSGDVIQTVLAAPAKTGGDKEDDRRR